MKYQFDVVVVGSGPAGVHVAYPLIKGGLRVAMIDGGLDSKKQDEELIDLSDVNITQKSFSYGFIKKSSFVFNTTYRLLKIKSNVEVIQSLAKGGLSEIWSGICDFFTSDELRAIGLPAKDLEREYGEIAKLLHLTFRKKLDIHGSLLLDAAQNKTLLHSMVSRAPIVFPYRTRSFVDDLKQYSNFIYIPHQLVVDIGENNRQVDIHTYSIDRQATSTYKTRFLILAAGSVNTTRIVLKSLKLYNHKTTFLTKPNYLVACLHPKALFKKGDPKKSPFGQVVIASKSGHRGVGAFFVQLYPLNPLALTKILRFVPLPKSLALPVLSSIASSIVIADVRFPGIASENTFCVLKKDVDNTDVLHVRFQESKAERKHHEEELDAISHDLRSLGLYPFKKIFGYTTTHYAGGVPFQETPRKASVDSSGKLHQTKNIYIADSSTWRVLPAKPIALTIMANAARVGKNVLKRIRRE